MKTLSYNALLYIKKIVNFFWIDFARYNKNHNKRLNNYPIDTVIDIWANIGQFLSEYETIFPSANFHCFEPLPSAFKILENKYWDNKNISLYNVGLGSVETITKINESIYNPSSSILEMTETHKNAFPHTKSSTSVDITIKTLDSFVFNWNHLLVKIDTQWYELEIIKWWKNTIALADICIIESSFYALYKWQPLFDSIYNSMTSLWFIYHWSLEQWFDPNDWKLLFQDSVFIKNNETI